MNPSYRLTVKVTMGDKRTVLRFGKIVKSGSFQPHVRKNKKINNSYSWVACARKAEHIIRLLYPWLITKRDEADVAIKFMELPDGRTGGPGGCKPLDPKLLLARHRLYLQCCRLKPRCRFRKNRLPEKPEKPRLYRWIEKRLHQ